MVALEVAYYSITFIICLLMISRVIMVQDILTGDREDIRNTFVIFCLNLIAWSIVVVCVGISQLRVLDVCLLLIAEFMKIGTFVCAAELFASLTDRIIGKKLSIYSISSELLYLGIIPLVARIIFDKGDILKSYFGDTLALNSSISMFTNIAFFVMVLFFCGVYTYMHYYTCSNIRRQVYITKNLTLIVIILCACLCIEAIGYVSLKTYIPSMYFGMVVCAVIFRNLLIYKRSIEYDEHDYERILEPAHQKPAFVCDDEGRVLFENTRAFVMRQTYKDTYKGRFLTEIFEITDYDRERLKDARMTQLFDVYCRYPKESREMLLRVRHNLDKFGMIFSTEVEVEYANAQNEEVVVAAGGEEKVAPDISVDTGDLINMRTSELIKQLNTQKHLYETGQRELFEYNIKGISKVAASLSMPALEELCDRIQTELTYGEWDGLSSMMIDIDRQYETLVMLNV